MITGEDDQRLVLIFETPKQGVGQRRVKRLWEAGGRYDGGKEIRKGREGTTLRMAGMKGGGTEKVV